MLLQIFKTQSIRDIVHDDWSCLFATAVTVMVVATPEGLPLSATLTCGIFYEMPDYTMVWEPSACYTMD